MPTYCIYLRKSRTDVEAEARGEGETLSRHERALVELATRERLPIGTIYREIVSGDTIAERPVMQKVLTEVQAGLWSGVLVMEIERLARGDTVDQGIVAQAFKYSQTRIITPIKVYDPNDEMDEEYFEFSLFMSRREYKTIKRRLQAGRVASVKEGRYMGSRPVYGYKRVKLEGQKGYSLEVVPDKAAIVRAIFDWYANGMDGAKVGAASIANRLIRMGIKTDMGNDFTQVRIRDILRNPAYIGMVQWNQRKTVVSMVGSQKVKARPKSDQYMLIRGLHAPIIDVALYNRVQAMFDTHEKRPINENKRIRNPLAGLVKCALCGKAIIRKPDYAGRGELLFCSTAGCPTNGTYVCIVEKMLLDTLKEWVPLHSTPAAVQTDIPENLLEPNDINAAAQRQLQAQLEVLGRQQSKLYDLLEQGVYSVELFAARNKELAERVSVIQDSIKRLEPTFSMEAAIQAIIPAAKNVLESYVNAPTPADKNALLRTTVSVATYQKLRRCFRNEDPSEYITLVVYPVVVDRPGRDD